MLLFVIYPQVVIKLLQMFGWFTRDSLADSEKFSKHQQKQTGVNRVHKIC